MSEDARGSGTLPKSRRTGHEVGCIFWTSQKTANGRSGYSGGIVREQAPETVNGLALSFGILGDRLRRSGFFLWFQSCQNETGQVVYSMATCVLANVRHGRVGRDKPRQSRVKGRRLRDISS